MPKQTIHICWFRRDLRLNDNAALYQALNSGLPVLPIFIFDKAILDLLEDKADKRVEFIHTAISEMNKQLAAMGSSMEVYYGFPSAIFQMLQEKYNVKKVFTNHDYEPYAIQRDAAIEQQLKEYGATFHTCKDQVIFEKTEVTKDDGKPYSVFTPYSKRWKAKLDETHTSSYVTEPLFSNFYKQPVQQIPSLAEMGFLQTGASFPLTTVKDETIIKYKEQRDIPSIAGTSRLSVHLRFGTISIRQLANHVKNLNESFLNELIWRDFYHMILWNFPQVGQGKSFKKEYDFIQWRNNEQEFEAWCNGQTGYPIVDAGMRELNTTGFMHNRVRMIVASFLCKHLLIDWRWGETYFAKKLLDFDMAANNGGWQWAAGSGCDAAPYFRIFNPYLQTKNFDPKLEYVRKWVPEFEGFNYAKPIVEHEVARKRCLQTYQKVLTKN
jgi:deoxyribodipyrimidine photo-lyase